MNIILLLTIISIVLLLNIFLIFVIVVKQRNKPQFILPWVFIMTILPLFGFVLYTFYGLSLNKKIRKTLKQKKQVFNLQKVTNGNNLVYSNFDSYLKNLNSSKVCRGKTQIFTHSVDKIASLKKDIINAEKSINLEYYIFQNDKIGREIMFLLCQKARQGVKVNLIYDAVGSKKSSKSFFNKLTKSGGQVKCFFPSFLFSFLNSRYNYRNHRKIVVIDNKIGYFGGMNICLDKVNNVQPRPWVDIHYRVEGQLVNCLQQIFLADFTFLKGEIDNKNFYLNNQNCCEGNSLMQIVTSGPEERLEKSLSLIIKAITTAKKSVYIQTPYFVPNDCFLNAIKQASLSGVEIKIMLPGKQDRKILQTVAFYYISRLKDTNIKFYLYEGFLHSKLLLADNKIAIGGSANYDNRSFSLNFELSCVFYDKQTVKKLAHVFETDLQKCTKINDTILKKYKADKPIKSVLAEVIAPFL